MILNALEEIENKVKNWFKDNYKYLLVILIYLLYQSNFLIGLISLFGVPISKIPRIPRILLFALTDLVYVITLLFMFKKDIINGFKDLKKNFSKRALLSVNCWLLGCIIMTTSSFLISLILKQNVSTNEALVRESIKSAPLYMLFTCSLVAPILEEMVFRKSFYGLIKVKWLFVILSGLLFGLLHVLGSFTSPLDFLYVIPYGAMGSCFAYLLCKTDNITLPIIIHMLHNTVLVMVQIIGR